MNIFWSVQASQAIEKVDSRRENPRKSKSKRPPAKAHFATRSCLAADIQMARSLKGAASPAASPIARLCNRTLADIGPHARFLLSPPCNPLKRHDRRRFAAENGGKRRRLKPHSFAQKPPSSGDFSRNGGELRSCRESIGAVARLALAASLVILGAASSASADDLVPTVDLRPGQKVTVPVSIAAGRIGLGAPRLSKPGFAEPKDGEIMVGVVKNGLSPYAELYARERTPLAIDIVATGLIGDIKIDEVKLCGKLDQPIASRIASGSWRVSLNRFAVHGEGQACP
jgi:hypothetical protein